VKEGPDNETKKQFRAKKTPERRGPGTVKSEVIPKDKSLVNMLQLCRVNNPNK
jgi:hypothetical protein